MTVLDGDLVQYLKMNIQENLGIPTKLQCFIYSMKSIQEDSKM